MLFSNPYIKLEPDGEVTLNTDTHIVELKLKEGKFGEEESFEELGEMARDSRVSKAKLRGDYTDEKIRVGSLWHSLKKDPFTGKKIVVKLTGNKYGRVQFVIKGTDMRSDETKELFFSLYAPNKSYGEEESFEENTTEGLSDNNTVFLGTDNGCLGTDNGNSFIGETENAEEDAQDFGEGEEGLTYKGKKLKPVKHTKQPRDPNKFLMQFSIFQIRDNIEINESLGKKLEKHSYWIMDDKIVTVGIMYRKYYLCQIKDRIAQDIISKEKMFGEGEVKLKEIENELTAIEGEIGESEISAPVLDLITEIKADLSVEFGEGAKEDRATKKIKKVEETISSVLTKIANLSYELKQMKFFKVSEQVDEVWKKANKGLRESRNIMGNISVWGIDGSTYGETENAEVETIGEGEVTGEATETEMGEAVSFEKEIEYKKEKIKVYIDGNKLYVEKERSILNENEIYKALKENDISVLGSDEYNKLPFSKTKKENIRKKRLTENAPIITINHREYYILSIHSPFTTIYYKI